MNTIIILSAACTLGGYLVGVFLSSKRAIKAEKQADRYFLAIRDLDQWCGHPFPAARIIARHLKAIGEGLPINAGTPCGEEACTVMGLRQQLTRLREQQDANSDRSNQGEEARPACYILPSALEWMRELGKVSTRLHASPTAVTSLALYTRAAVAEAVELNAAARDVLAERRRQQEVEGWTPEHDDEHVSGEISALAAFYAMPPAAREWDASSTGYGETLGEAMLPPDWRAKPGERREELKKAGALILAEIERLDRAAEKGGAQ